MKLSVDEECSFGAGVMTQLLRALSCRDPRFRSQPLHGDSQLSVTHIPGDQMTFLPSVGTAHGDYNICRQNFKYLYIYKSLICMADKLITNFKTYHEGIK